MNEPDIKLHIEELVVHGLGTLDRERLGGAVQCELRRLLANRGLASAPVARAWIDAGTIEAPNGGDAAEFGRRIARSAYSAMGAKR